MQAETGTPIEIVQVIQSLIVLFIAAPALIRAIFRISQRAAASAAGWRRGGTDEHAPISPADEELVVVRARGRRCRGPLAHAADRRWSSWCILGRSRSGIFALGARPRTPVTPTSGCAPAPTPSSCPTSPSPPAPTAIALGLIIVAAGGVPRPAGVHPAADAVGARGGVRVLRGGVPVLGEHAAARATRSTSPGCSEHDPVGRAAGAGRAGGVLCERSGVINVAIEGQFLAGAWAAALDRQCRGHRRRRGGRRWSPAR